VGTSDGRNRRLKNLRYCTFKGSSKVESKKLHFLGYPIKGFLNFMPPPYKNLKNYLSEANAKRWTFSIKMSSLENLCS
jgi:hypothetical protein